MSERDEEAARKFAVEWSTKSRGKIANLAGCYLRALADAEKWRAQEQRPAKASVTAAESSDSASVGPTAGLQQNYRAPATPVTQGCALPIIRGEAPTAQGSEANDGRLVRSRDSSERRALSGEENWLCLYCGKPTGGRYYYCSRLCEKALPESGSEQEPEADLASKPRRLA